MSVERRWSAVDLMPSREDLLKYTLLGNWEIKPWEDYTSANPPHLPCSSEVWTDESHSSETDLQEERDQ